MPIERFPVEAGHVMAFARAIGDGNQVYVDADDAASRGLDGVIAPPTFVEAGAHFDPDYPLRPKPGRAWPGIGSGGSGSEEVLALHAEQHYLYARPLEVGDVLSATTSKGRSWEREGRRGGKLRFEETITEYRDEAGDLVVTSRSVEVRTERAPEDL